MRNMKDSGIEWIGKIPEDWNVCKILYCLKMPLTDGPHTTPELYDDGVPFVSAEAVSCGNGRIDFEHIRGFISEEFYQECCKKYVPRIDDIYMIKSGATTGKVAIVETERKFTIWSPLAVFRTDIQKVLPKYMFYFLQSNGFQKQVELGWSFGTQQNIGMRALERLNIAFPPLDEQKKIADFLDAKCADIDQIRADIEKQIEILTDYKKSVITEAVTKGLDPKAKLKDSGIEWIGKIPEGWDVKRFKYIADALYKGNGITKEQVFLDGNTQCVRYGEIYSKYNISFSDCLSLTKCELISSPQYFEYGDILFAGTGELVEEIGKNIVYLGNEKCLAGGDIVVARHSQNPSFLNYALGSSYCQSQKSSGKAKLKVVHISATQIGNILVAIPPLPEQKAIADYLDEKCSEIDATIAEKQKQLETLDEYKKSLIFEYVTGKKEVPA